MFALRARLHSATRWITAPIGRRVDRTFRLRRLVQAGFALTCVAIGVQFTLFVRAAQNGQLPLPDRPAGVEGFLPISGLMGLRDWWSRGELNDIHPAATMIVLIVVAIALLLRKAFCSWICPVGLISEMTAWLGRRLYRRNFRFWKPADVVLRSVKFLLLGFFLHAIWTMPEIGLRAFLDSPYNRVADIKMGLFFVHIGQVGLTVMILLVVFSTFVNGFWCRYLCPYGALLGIVGWFSPTRVQRDPVSCIDCRKCDAVCMARLPVSRSGNVLSMECTGCFDCVAACPVSEALVVKSGPRRVPVWAFAATVVLLFVGGYVSARVAGHWDNTITDLEYVERMKWIDDPTYGHPGGEMMGGSEARAGGR